MEGGAMKTKNALLRLVAAAALPLVMMLAGCDNDDCPLGGCPPPSDAPQDQAFRIDCNWSQHAGTTVFDASGAIEDAGTVTGDDVPWGLDGDGPSIWTGVRTFHGKSGDLKVFVEAIQNNGGSDIARGEFVIAGGTDHYVGYQAEGEFSLAVDGQVGLTEVFEGKLVNDK